MSKTLYLTGGEALSISMAATDESLVQEALRLVQLARSKGLILRMMGHTAIRIHCPNNLALLVALGRFATDIDFASYTNQKKDITSFFFENAYHIMRHITPGAFRGRETFTNQQGMHVDLFFDKLEFCHTIDFRNRLQVDYPTIPLSTLLLEKMQIVEINEKDIKDTIILLLEHEVGEWDEETINAREVAKVLAEHWGFYYTVTTNLKRIMDFIERYDGLTEKDRRQIADRIARLFEYVGNEPKSVGWKMRASVGPRKKWYNDVEEVERAEWLKIAEGQED